MIVCCVNSLGCARFVAGDCCDCVVVTLVNSVVVVC